MSIIGIYNPKSEKAGTVCKTQIKKESSDFFIYFDLYFIADNMNTKYFMFWSGQLHVICKYTSFPVIQTCNTFPKKLGQEQFRASNEVNWLIMMWFETGDVNRWL